MTGTASAHHRGAPAARVFTVLAALALRALGMWRDSRVHAAHRAGALAAVFCSEQRSPRGPIRRSMATIDSASVDYAVCPRLLRPGLEKIITVPEIRSCRTSSKLGPTQAF